MPVCALCSMSGCIALTWYSSPSGSCSWSQPTSGLLQDKAILVRHLAAHHKAAAERWAQLPLLEQLGRERHRILKQLLK